MRTSVILLGLGWFWLCFYGVGPLTTWWQLALGGLALLAGCLVFALWGAAIVRRRPR